MTLPTIPAPGDVTGQMLLLDFFQQVYQPLRMADSAAKSVGQIRVGISLFGKYLGRDAMLADLTEDALSGWMRSDLDRKLSPATCNSRRRILLSLWRLAKRKRYPIPGDDDLDRVDRYRIPTRQPQAWLMPELVRLIESARLATGRIAGVPAGKFWPALLLVMLDTGLRRAPVFAIRFEEIDFQSKMLLVPVERMKNAVEQYFRLSDQTIEAILETLPPRRDKVFPFPFIGHDSVYSRLRTILQRAGLPSTKHDLFHKIRRTTASFLAQIAGKHAAIIQLGHQDQSCINRYIDPRFTANHDGALLLPRPSWTAPVAIQVEEVEKKAPTPAETRTIRVASADLRGAGDDVFARLKGKRRLAPKDIADALKALGINHCDFATEIGVTPQWLSTVLQGRAPIGEELNERIRVGLGITHARRVSKPRKKRPARVYAPGQ